MEVSITKFRREMFALVNQAMEGKEVWVTNKGRRFKIAPENAPGSRLSRISSMDVINPEATGSDDRSLLEEMARAWEKDWSEL